MKHWHSMLSAVALLVHATGHGGETLKLPLGDREVSFSRIEGADAEGGPLLLSLHSDESTAILAATELLKRNSGTLYILENGGDRRIPVYSTTRRLTVDPNRIFSKAGITKDLRRFSIFRETEADHCAKFGQALLEMVGVTESRTVVALHNNTNGAYSIRSYLPGGSESKAAAKVHQGSDDEDNFFLVTEWHRFESLSTRGFNVVLQDNTNAPDDGSLSVHCGRHGIPYINVEAEKGNLEFQTRMLEALFEEFKNAPIPDPRLSMRRDVGSTVSQQVPEAPGFPKLVEALNLNSSSRQVAPVLRKSNSSTSPALTPRNSRQWHGIPQLRNPALAKE